MIPFMTHAIDHFAEQQPTLEVVALWLDAAVAEKLIPAVQARLRKTAVARLNQVRAADEPNDAAWVRENLDRLAERLVNTGVEAATALTYKSRASSALREFLDYRGRPSEFRAAKQGRGAGVRRGASGAGTGDFSTFPLGGGRVFRYQVPPGFTRRDLDRVWLHLLALVEDFDEGTGPRRAVQLPLEMGITRTDSSQKSQDR